MLNVQVSKNVEDYQESVVAGLNFEKTLYSVAALVVGGVLMTFITLVFNIDINIAFWIAMPFMAFIIFLGFYSKDGLTFKQILYRKRFVTHKKANYLLSDDNCYLSYQNLLIYESEKINKSNIDKEDEFKKSMELLIKKLLYSALIFILIVTAVVIILILK